MRRISSDPWGSARPCIWEESATWYVVLNTRYEIVDCAHCRFIDTLTGVCEEKKVKGTKHPTPEERPRENVLRSNGNDSFECYRRSMQKLGMIQEARVEVIGFCRLDVVFSYRRM